MREISPFKTSSDYLLLPSRKRIELTSLATINFSIFRRSLPCKVVLYCGNLQQNLQKIYSPLGAKQLRKNRFFQKRAKFFEKYTDI